MCTILYCVLPRYIRCTQYEDGMGSFRQVASNTHCGLHSVTLTTCTCSASLHSYLCVRVLISEGTSNPRRAIT